MATHLRLNEIGLAYVATPFSAYPLGIERAWIDACKIAARLLKIGVRVYSPIAHTHSIAIHGELDAMDLSIWLPFDEAMMEKCDSLVVAHLSSWELSKGIAHEIAFFERAGKPIFDLDPETLKITRRS